METLNRELSWLSFNERVLQEAADVSNPLLERLKFLGIFSNNLDEFYRVRVATIRRLTLLNKRNRNHLQYNPKKLLIEIQETVLKQTKWFETIYTELKSDLKKHQVYIINEKEADITQKSWLNEYFNTHIKSNLFPLILNQIKVFPNLKDKVIYLAIKMYKEIGNIKTAQYAILEIPEHLTGRFITLPSKSDKVYVMLTDDIIRLHLESLLLQFGMAKIDAYTFKITRDAEMDLESDINKSWLDKISKGVKKRKKGDPVRFVYDEKMPPGLLNYLMEKLRLNSENCIPGGRYHNFKDFINFPSNGKLKLLNPPFKSIQHPSLKNKALFEAMSERDILLHYPYHSFQYMVDWLRQAAIDPQVKSIKITLYRLAKNSQIINALINAAQNGKAVTAVVELQARFDEEANINWSRILEDEGVHVIHGVPGLKVHSKVCLIEKYIQKKQHFFLNISTGNYNEQTSKLYCDESLFTCNKNLCKEANALFDFFEKNYQVYPFKHLVLSPLKTRKRFIQLIENEIEHQKSGKQGFIFLKMNSLVDETLIYKLYEASNTGVKIKLIIRGICCLKPGIKGMSENIEAISIIDRFLEHSRIYYFGNNTEPIVYLSSADWMGRNLDVRIEVSVPIYDSSIISELKEYMDIQWSGNIKTRIIDSNLSNTFKKGRIQIRPQLKYAEHIKSISVKKHRIV